MELCREILGDKIMRKILRFMECLHPGTKVDRPVSKLPAESVDEDSTAAHNGWHQPPYCSAQTDMKAPLSSPFGEHYYLAALYQTHSYTNVSSVPHE
jgi:hypothetical protein